MELQTTTDTVENGAADSKELSSFLVSWVNHEGEQENGPLSVLWQLIESYRVDIFDISLQRITEDFFNFIRRAGELKLELVSSFSVMAAKLLFYKSKALLPDPGFDEPDPEDRLPPELIQQLLEYRKFQLAADRLHEFIEITSGMFTREAGVAAELSESDSSDGWLDVSVVDLVRAYARVLERFEEENRVGPEMELFEDEFSVSDKIALIRNLLQTAVSFLFDDLFENIREMQRTEIVSTFLAILELVKSGEISIRQKENFGPIHIFKKAAVVY